VTDTLLNEHAEIDAVPMPVTKSDFDVAFARYGAAVLRYAWRLTRNSDDAEELVQETFLTLWSKRRSLVVVGDSVLPWLLVTCRNHSGNLSRRRKRNEAAELDAEVPARSAAEERAAAELEWVMAEIAAMSPLDREVCRLCLIDGIPYKDAAAQLKLNTSAVAKRVERARRRLKNIRSESD
jgi:RNA polymerase sigma factor (sigma-70 family)